jgi:uncharacterized membrane protein
VTAMSEEPELLGPAERMDESTRLSPTGRVEAFSDGVMAIAITLLVLNLRTPSAEEASRPGGLLAALLEEWPSTSPIWPPS